MSKGVPEDCNGLIHRLCRGCREGRESCLGSLFGNTSSLREGLSCLFCPLSLFCKFKTGRSIGICLLLFAFGVSFIWVFIQLDFELSFVWVADFVWQLPFTGHLGVRATGSFV